MILMATSSYATRYPIDVSIIDEPVTIKISDTFFNFPENTIRGGMTGFSYSSYHSFVIVQDSQNYLVAIQQRDEGQHNPQALVSYPLVNDLLFRTTAPAKEVEKIKQFLLSIATTTPPPDLDSDQKLSKALNPKLNCPDFSRRREDCKEYFDDGVPNFQQVKAAAIHRSKFFRMRSAKFLSERFSSEPDTLNLMLGLLEDPKIEVRRSAIEYVAPFLKNEATLSRIIQLALYDSEKSIWPPAVRRLANGAPNMAFEFVRKIDPSNVEITQHIASYLSNVVSIATKEANSKSWRTPSDGVKIAILGLSYIQTFTNDATTKQFGYSMWINLQKKTAITDPKSFATECAESNNVEISTYAKKLLTRLNEK